MPLFSNEFKTFFDNIPVTSNGVEELAGQITKSVTPVADVMGIGKLEITMVHSPATAFAPSINNGSILLYYYSGGYDESPIKYNYTTGINGQVELAVYPRTGKSWNNDELAHLETLAKVLYTICAKARITSLLNVATTTDGLTSVSNSIGTYRFITEKCESGKQADFTAVFYNIKNFRIVNQRFGAQNGDIALKKYAQKIKDILEDDEIIGRMGGDNFVSLVRNEHLNEFIELLGNVKVLLNINNKIVPIEISARGGVYPIAPNDNMSTVMNSISIALTVAKKSQHHDFIWFRPTMMEKTIHDKELAGAFASALEHNEFVVYYQPKIDFNTKKLCGCEALSRWKRKGELLEPAQFIHILEREGTICALDFYVLNKVCNDIKEWLSEGLTPVCVSSNFSRLHMHNQHLAEDIADVVTKSGIDPKYIEIEITESIGYEDFEALDKFVNKLHGFGIRTSIDDFGTGYSSLNLISELNVDVIKLDRSFITPPKQTENESEKSYNQRLKSNYIVVKTIINMALELGLEVICEGVETKEQANMLEDMGCHLAQGFLYDRPIPRSEFESRLNDYNYSQA